MAASAAAAVSQSSRAPICELIHAHAAGANLMGSDLYNSLIKYLSNHLKELKDVRPVAIVCTASTGANDKGFHRHPIPFKMRRFSATTPPSGNDTRPGPTTSTVCSPISTVTGSSVNGMRGGRPSTPCTPYVPTRQSLQEQLD
jgi:hypothetical protein